MLEHEYQRLMKTGESTGWLQVHRMLFAHLRRGMAEAVIVLIGMPLLRILRLIRPFLNIRIGMLHYGRFGHLVSNTEFWLRRRSLHKNHVREINLFLTGNPANRQVLTMIKRRVTVLENDPLVKLFGRLRSRSRGDPIWIDLGDSGFNSWEIWNGGRPQLTFTEDECREGEIILRTLGIPLGVPYVCFSARDRAYLDKVHNYRPRDEWSYHDYRDCDINNYLPAAEWLARQGLWALRMGAVVEQPINSSHPRVIDYATKFRSDFADVYLMAHCKFFLGCTGGVFILASAFGVPSALANMTPFSYAARSPHDLFIPKKYWHVGSKRFLTFREVLGLGADRWLRTQQFKAADIKVVENTSDEILILAMEMSSRLEGEWVSQDEDDELQERFRALFSPDHPIAGYPSRVGAEFLRQNRRLLD